MHYSKGSGPFRDAFPPKNIVTAVRCRVACDCDSARCLSSCATETPIPAAQLAGRAFELSLRTHTRK